MCDGVCNVIAGVLHGIILCIYQTVQFSKNNISWEEYVYQLKKIAIERLCSIIGSSLGSLCFLIPVVGPVGGVLASSAGVLVGDLIGQLVASRLLTCPTAKEQKRILAKSDKSS